MRPASETRLLAAFGLALAVFALIAVAAARSAQRLDRYAASVGVQREVLARLNELLTSVTDAETGMRGYVITHDESYLEPYAGQYGQAREELSALGRMLRQDPVQAEAIARLEPLVERRFALLDQTVDLMKREGFAAARASIVPGEGKEVHGRIRAQVQALERAVDAGLAVSRREADAAAADLKRAALAGGALSLLLIGAAALRAIRDMRALRRMQERLQEAGEHERELTARLSRILDASLDAICVFDAEGRFVFASPACEQVWGYRPEELLGTPYLEKVVAEDRPRTIEAATAIMAGTDAFDFRNRYERKDGTVAHVMWTARWSAEEGRMFCIARDVTESERLREEARRHLETLTRTAAELERARAKAESADRLKSAFLATMSHELRTPLNSIIGFTGVLLQELPGPLNDEQRKQLGIVVAGARHLLALINDVLDISKIEAGQLAVAREDFDFAAVVAKAAAAVRPLAEEKGLAFAVRLGDGLGTVSGDARRVEQVLLNLLGNAVKFTEQGAITLSAEPIASLRPGEATSACSAVRASVADSGPGIRPGDLARLFRPFEQVAGGLSRAHEGTGLGLAISRRLAELMGGTIEVDSRWQEGSTFTFTIPRAPEANP